MSSKQSQASKEAMATNRGIAQGYYDIALPALRSRQDEINASLAAGEPDYMKAAFLGQRGALATGGAARMGAAQAQQYAGGKAALSGGNFASTMNPADLGAQLANALYGSRFAEGQANIDQQFNLMGMALGGAGTAGSGALGAAQNQLQTIGFMPNYNPTYANIMGGLAGASSIYGAFNQYGGFGRPTVPGASLSGLPGVTPGTVSGGL